MVSLSFSIELSWRYMLSLEKKLDEYIEGGTINDSECIDLCYRQLRRPMSEGASLAKSVVKVLPKKAELGSLGGHDP